MKKIKIVLLIVSIVLFVFLLWTFIEIFMTYKNYVGFFANINPDNIEFQRNLIRFEFLYKQFNMIIIGIVPIFTLSFTILYTISYTEKSEKRRKLIEVKPFLSIYIKAQGESLKTSIANVGNKTALNVRIINQDSQKIDLINTLMSEQEDKTERLLRKHFSNDYEIIIQFEDLLDNTYNQKFTSKTNIIDDNIDGEFYLKSYEPSIIKYNPLYKI